MLWFMRLAAADHRLANWEELLDELTPRQVTTLQAFQRIERWGEERNDLRAAVGIATIASAVSMAGKPVDPQKIFELLQPERTKPDDGCVSPNQVAAMMKRARPKEKNVDRR